MRMTMPKNKTCPIKVFFYGCSKLLALVATNCCYQNCCSFWIGRILKVFPQVWKFRMNVPSRDPGSTGYDVFFWIHIWQIYTDITIIYIETSKLMLALESCAFHYFSSHVVPMETNESPLWPCAKTTATSSSCFVTVTILYFVDAHDFYGWFVLEWRWFVQDALL